MATSQREQTERTTVAIVDDDERLIAALVRDLGARGYDVHTARSAQEALRLLEQHDVDVMLTDLRMSGRDGIDLIRAVGILSPDTRSILMSAFATAKDYKVAMDLGAVDVLGKPFTPDELHATLDKAIGWDDSVRGDMQGVSLTDVLTLFHSGRRSATIRLGGTLSAIHMRDGEIVHAEHGRLTGQEALRSLLSAPLGRVRTGALESGEQSIEQPFRRLLDELMSTLKKQRRTREVPAVDRQRVAKQEEVRKMSGSANQPRSVNPPSRSAGGQSSRTMPMVIGGVMGVALGTLLLALGIQRGAEVPQHRGEPSAAVRQVDIDVSAWLGPSSEPSSSKVSVADDESGAQELAVAANDAVADPAQEEQPEEPEQVDSPSARQKLVASRAAPRRRRPRPAARRSRPRPAPAKPEPAASEPTVAANPAPAPPEPRKPSIGTIAAKQPAIGAMQSAKPVIGTVSR